MRRSIAIGFLILYLFANTELREIMRLPVLIEHFAEHKQRTPDINFISYLVLHYFDGSTKDGDYQRDQQLPFKGQHCEEVSTPLAILSETSPAPSPEIPSIVEKSVMYVSPLRATLYQFTIWQPPRA